MAAAAAPVSTVSKSQSHCAFCNKSAAETQALKVCSACKAVRYCNVDCQRADWTTHKPKCVPIAAAPNAAAGANKASAAAAPISGGDAKSNGKEEGVYACVSTDCLTTVYLTEKEKGFLDQLRALPMDKILDRGPIEESCKAIGQAIFDHYKAAAGGNSMAGKAAAQKLCDLLKTHSVGGNLRKQYVEYAWDYIGDKNWSWHH